MYHNDLRLHSDLDKGNAFIAFNTSVYSPKVDFTMPNIASDPHIILTNLDISKIQSMNRGCHDSSLMGCDIVPSFVIHQSAEVISPPVHVLFQSISNSKQ